MCEGFPNVQVILIFLDFRRQTKGPQSPNISSAFRGEYPFNYRGIESAYIVIPQDKVRAFGVYG